MTFAVCRDHVADVVLVDDAAIVAAGRLLWDRLRLVVEPAAATTVAALATGALSPAPGERIGVVLSGANTAPGDVDN